VIPVQISDAAIVDISNMWDQIATISAAAASRISDDVIDSSLSLGQFPERHPRLPTLGSQIRRMVVGSWAVVYEVNPGMVEILRIVPTGADLTLLQLRPSSES